ncbi:uncharacterized protein LOC130948245 [Arachis stenosperma]|uniref:uncharacterized protein LOC130948245 n=1 Tax=Arachis stenosperma TaxID=217475 RepID=UPI0025ABA8BB|nr:uncharacterized protein LOC130948245 [Arachis stenosperma]
MTDNGARQPTQAELMTQMAELQAEVKRLAELTQQNQANKREEGNPKSSTVAGTDLLITNPPKERLTLDNPFSEEITNYQMPKHFTLPSSLEPYKGIGDPRAHLKKFQSMMFFNGPKNEPVLCRAFPTYLDGAALLWFSKLPEGSISSFEELARSFIDYFAAARIYVHGSDYLGTIRQGPQESLKDYLTRFADATMEIPDLDPAVHLHAIKAGLKPGKFRETIAVTKPKSLEEFRERAAGQMEIEELREAENRDRKQPRKEENRPIRAGDDRGVRKAFKLTPKFDNYTRFNTKRERIIKEILNAKIIKPPVRAGSYQDQRFVDKNKHCAFHQKYGHTTDECIIAKDLLERLARQGLLDKYIEGTRHKGAKTNSDEQQTPRNKEGDKWPNHNPPKGIINCISGGFACGGETASARKRSYRTMLAIEQTTMLSRTKDDNLEITFNQSDVNSAAPNADDPVVISIQTGDLLVRKVLLDPGSSADVLFYSTFLKMNLPGKLIQPSSGELVGFSGERVPIKVYIWLKTTMGQHPLSRTFDIQYLIVDCTSPYNIILGRPALNTFRAVISTFHLCVKFQAQDGRIATIHSDRQQAQQCYNSSLKRSDTKQKQHETEAIQTRKEALAHAELDPREHTQERPQPTDELQEIQLTSRSEQVTYIGQALQGQERSDLIRLLRNNSDLFAWTPADMPGISPDVICHKLATNPASRPIAQKKRKLGAEKSKAALEETNKLLQANFIREIRFTTWLSNVVMVRKNSGKWRMCVDFTDLNKACPKDAYPLPCIDKLVDNASGFKSLSFMDAYSGYNQILMHPEDQSKTAFITEHGNFCYRVMPFGLKNAGATYQRLMDKVFHHQIGRNMEIYVDDMVAKTAEGMSHCEDLGEIFRQLRVYNMRLNPEKCAFGVRGGKFLGFILTSRGIEANPEKCSAVLNMSSPTTIKQVQQLAGRIAALSRFIPAASDKAYHLFQTISKNKKFDWTEEAEKAFSDLKRILSSPPVLQKPEIGKPLYLYLSVSNFSISSALVIETGKIQRPVYFVSRVMQPTEQRYPKIEQLALALITAARRLRHYFQSHTIIVRTNQPLRQILTKPELAGRLTKWSIELSEFDVQFQPRSALKSQVLADFISEMTTKTQDKSWELHVDGASSREGSGAGIILKEGDEVIAEQALQFNFPASNNQAEYEALIAGLKLALNSQARSLTTYCDSLLVVQQIRGEFQVKDPLLEQYWLLAKGLISKFNSFNILHVKREQNVRADILSKLAATRANTQTSALTQLSLEKPSTELLHVMSINNLHDWRTPFLEYISTGTIPRHEHKPQNFRRKASLYTSIDGKLYRRGFSQPLLRCLNNDEAKEVVDEVHEGVCGNHIGGRALAAKIIRTGYYWPTLKRDCITKVKTCDNCQKHGAISTRPAELLHTMEVSWPFHRWGLDILGPFPTAPGQVKFLLVAVDYFSKWIEAQPLARITAEKVRSFIWKNIICRFGIPREIISDNGRQFIDNKLRSFLQSFNIKHYFSSVEHPQTNGQAEAANRVILQAIKKKLNDAKGEWAELIPEILWSYNTTIQATTGETPFKLVYGSEALIPIEIGISTLRTDLYDEQHNLQARRTELDLAEETRELATIRQRAAKQMAEKKHNKRVSPRTFTIGDLVLRKTEEARRPPTHGKLAANWEGPFRVIKVLGMGAYQLQTLQGNPVAGNWNISSLKIYHS